MLGSVETTVIISQNLFSVSTRSENIPFSYMFDRNHFGTRIISANVPKSIWNTYNKRKCSTSIWNTNFYTQMLPNLFGTHIISANYQHVMWDYCNQRKMSSDRKKHNKKTIRFHYLPPKTLILARTSDTNEPRLASQPASQPASRPAGRPAAGFSQPASRPAGQPASQPAR